MQLYFSHRALKKSNFSLWEMEFRVMSNLKVPKALLNMIFSNWWKQQSFSAIAVSGNAVASLAENIKSSLDLESVPKLQVNIYVHSHINFVFHEASMCSAVLDRRLFISLSWDPGAQDRQART